MTLKRITDPQKATKIGKNLTLPSKDVRNHFVFFSFIGIAVLFTLPWMLNNNLEPATTFSFSLLTCCLALAIASIWLLKFRNGIYLFVALQASFFLRVFIGIYAYLSFDPNYFQGDGSYNWWHPEIVGSFNAAELVFYALERGTDISITFLSGILNSGDSKNPIIHLWMGSYLNAANSHNAMDLAPFNAFHMALGSLAVAALSISSGYRIRVAIASSIMTTMTPFSAISSLLWRDSIGFAFTMVSVLALSSFELKKPLTWTFLLASILLAFANRTVYPIILGALFFLSYFSDLGHNIRARKYRWLFVAVAIPLSLIVMQVASGFLFQYYTNFSITSLISKLAYFPILFTRALLGPFPWFDHYPIHEMLPRIFDYAYHVMQMAVWLCIAVNARNFFRKPDIMVNSFLLFFASATLAPGVHTAYLAVSIPFALPRIFSITHSFSSYFILSTLTFLFLNSIFYATGLSGLGLSQSITGY